MRHRLIAGLAVATALLASGCTWVHMAPGAREVRVIPAGGPPTGCEKRGEIAVSVKDSIAFYERNDLRVREELETLARNEGPGLDADTIQPLAPPLQGEQRFAGYHCGATMPVPSAAAPAQAEPRGAAQTFPIGG
ncbi:MAG: DUF4156 domain-containing protein [Proteobacteria bacterium]|nr:DUF4156 domain-containing protein [Pseudomonadota bacterium]